MSIILFADTVCILVYIVVCSKDGKDTLKLYTNPIFFFELWCSQIQKEVEKKRPTGKKVGVCEHDVCQRRSTQYMYIRKEAGFV